MKARPDARHFMYSCFDADGDLLYIGATSNYDDRVREYDRRPEVALIDRIEYPTRAEAFAAERVAIRQLQPRWNLQNNKGSLPMNDLPTDAPNNLPRDYTLEEVASALRMSTRWVRDRIKAGHAGEGPVIAHERRGHKIVFTADQVEALRNQFTVTPPPSQSITTGRPKRRAS